ncbi:Aste57867_14673 [Aphanomyces stellatus]|uniref:Aste57867_14673 protein n=1 Tax=Aphanomyces stellatus TaxID=120398 RepID=A0A485L1L5_9STRA|nr:hypothetical protein As57867_014618 [Aphanomyces stellatus]VFT91491.1 Aste57867_14673 [Aphanomyces stellatus]
MLAPRASLAHQATKPVEDLMPPPTLEYMSSLMYDGRNFRLWKARLLQFAKLKRVDSILVGTEREPADLTARRAWHNKVDLANWILLSSMDAAMFDVVAALPLPAEKWRQLVDVYEARAATIDVVATKHAFYSARYRPDEQTIESYMTETLRLRDALAPVDGSVTDAATAQVLLLGVADARPEWVTSCRRRWGGEKDDLDLALVMDHLWIKWEMDDNNPAKKTALQTGHRHGTRRGLVDDGDRGATTKKRPRVDDDDDDDFEVDDVEGRWSPRRNEPTTNQTRQTMSDNSTTPRSFADLWKTSATPSQRGGGSGVVYCKPHVVRKGQVMAGAQVGVDFFRHRDEVKSHVMQDERLLAEVTRALDEDSDIEDEDSQSDNQLGDEIDDERWQPLVERLWRDVLVKDGWWRRQGGGITSPHMLYFAPNDDDADSAAILSARDVVLEAVYHYTVQPERTATEASVVDLVWAHMETLALGKIVGQEGTAQSFMTPIVAASDVKAGVNVFTCARDAVIQCCSNLDHDATERKQIEKRTSAKPKKTRCCTVAGCLRLAQPPHNKTCPAHRGHRLPPLSSVAKRVAPRNYPWGHIWEVLTRDFGWELKSGSSGDAFCPPQDQGIQVSFATDRDVVAHLTETGRLQDVYDKMNVQLKTLPPPSQKKKHSKEVGESDGGQKKAPRPTQKRKAKAKDSDGESNSGTQRGGRKKLPPPKKKRQTKTNTDDESDDEASTGHIQRAVQTARQSESEISLDEIITTMRDLGWEFVVGGDGANTIYSAPLVAEDYSATTMPEKDENIRFSQRGFFEVYVRNLDWLMAIVRAKKAAATSGGDSHNTASLLPTATKRVSKGGADKNAAAAATSLPATTESNPRYKQITIGQIERALRSVGWKWVNGSLGYKYCKPHVAIGPKGRILSGTSGVDYFDSREEFELYVRRNDELLATILNKVDEDVAALAARPSKETIASQAQPSKTKPPRPPPRPQTGKSSMDQPTVAPRKQNKGKQVATNETTNETSESPKNRVARAGKRSDPTTTPVGSEDEIETRNGRVSRKTRLDEDDELKGVRPFEVKFALVYRELQREGWFHRLGKFGYDYFKPDVVPREAVPNETVFHSEADAEAHLRTSGLWAPIEARLLAEHDLLTRQSGKKQTTPKAKQAVVPTHAASAPKKPTKKTSTATASTASSPATAPQQATSPAGETDPLRPLNALDELLDSIYDTNGRDELVVKGERSSQKLKPTRGRRDAKVIKREVMVCLTAQSRTSPPRHRPSMHSSMADDDAATEFVQVVLTPEDFAAKTQRAKARLHPDFTPQPLLRHRDNEWTTVKQFVDATTATETGGSLFLSGTPGTGKSTVLGIMRAYVSDVWPAATPALESIHVNAAALDDAAAVFMTIAARVTQTDHATCADAVAALDVAFKRPTVTTFVYVDDIDVLLCGAAHDVSLAKWIEWAHHPLSSLVFVGVANSADLLGRYLAHLANGTNPSQTRPVTVEFEPYTFDQVVAVLTDRIESTEDDEALSPLVNSMALTTLARKIVSTSGDIGVALAIFRRVLDEKVAAVAAAAPSDGISPVSLKDVLAVVKDVFKAKGSPVLAGLSRRTQLALVALTRIEPSARHHYAIGAALEAYNTLVRWSCMDYLTLARPEFESSVVDTLEAKGLAARGGDDDSTAADSIQLLLGRHDLDRFVASDGFFTRFLPKTIDSRVEDTPPPLATGATP